ncbi:MAG: transporter [Gammaproteobacteria bacterium RIFCSPHIGHO2_12_FULL_45_9]|nr:MAG: transporter [Gammaproteobacteria bacterium RIFCSPHIGHO2_12_FULL_45_9]
MSLATRGASLGVFSLAMMTAGSVDSIRNLPATALFGNSLIFFFALGALFFLLPSALVAAELASRKGGRAGIFGWVTEAFGYSSGFLAVWFQWIENVIWYPTILSFIAATVGYWVSPDLAQSKAFLVSVIVVAFWGMTWLNLRGIQASAGFSNFCAIAGLLLPMSLIMGLGCAWILSGHPVQISLHPKDWLPTSGGGDMWVSLTGIMMSFCGMEIAAVHAGDVANPQRAYPRAMALATGIIVVTLLCGSLSIAAVLPHQTISLVAGIMQAFDVFFGAYHWHWILPFVALALVLGGLGGVNNWIIAPTRGLTQALREGNALARITALNAKGAPRFLLWVQAVIVMGVTLVFLLMPSVNGSYWFLTALTAELYMIMYIFMFVAAIRLRYIRSKQVGFCIPGGRVWGMWLVAGAGLLGTIVTIIVGFMPPAGIDVGGTVHYQMMLVGGLLVLGVPPWYWAVRRARRQEIVYEVV